MRVLDIKNITKSFGKHTVLRDVNITLDGPGITALVGPNGVGKTTLLNIIANLLIPNAGSVAIMGKSNKNVEVFQDMSYMMDNRVLYDYLTGWDHLKYVADTHKSTKDDIERASAYLNITPFLNKKISEYSLGMKQQLLFSMALVNDPTFLMMDEPFNGLDPSTIIKVRQILVDLKEKGKTILLSSHNLAEVDQMTSEIIFIKDAKVWEEDITGFKEGRYYFTIAKPELALASLADFSPRLENGEITVLPKGRLQEIINRLSAHGEITQIRREEIGSEKRYQEIYGV